MPGRNKRAAPSPLDYWTVTLINHSRSELLDSDKLSPLEELAFTTRGDTLRLSRIRFLPFPRISPPRRKETECDDDAWLIPKPELTRNTRNFIQRDEAKLLNHDVRKWESYVLALEINRLLSRRALRSNEQFRLNAGNRVHHQEIMTQRFCIVERI